MIHARASQPRPRFTALLLSLATVCLTAAPAAPRTTQSNPARRELDAALARYQVLLRQRFSTTLRSPEVNALISQQVAQHTHAILGLPLQIEISHFAYRYAPAGSTLTAHLANAPTGQSATVDDLANQFLQNSALGEGLRLLAFDALKEGIVYLAARKAEATVRNQTATTLDYALPGANQEVLPGLRLRESWFRLDRRARTFTALRFTFTNGTSLQAQVRYLEASLPTGGKAPTPTAAEITQDALLSFNGLPIPRLITVRYTPFVFAKP